MHLLLTGIGAFFIFLFGILPFPVLYAFSDLARFILQYVMKYRMKVIRENLTRCFPEKSPAEIDELITGAYKNLTDIIVEGIKAFTMTRAQLAARHKIINPEILDIYKGSGKSIIATPCHYGNWEWGAMAPSLQLDYQIIGFYTPLSNPYMDKLIRKNRSRTGAVLASTRKTSRTFDDFSEKKCVYIMAADQSPSKPEKAIWVDFLGQKTAFLNGPEKHARLRDLPVVFVDIQRVKRGFYTLELSYTSRNPKETKEGEITATYAHKLETVIREKPENWLWSHKRWKLNKD
ncbi:MAG: lysophospholipid acyltransferase family protein [bacterium]